MAMSFLSPNAPNSEDMAVNFRNQRRLFRIRFRVAIVAIILCATGAVAAAAEPTAEGYQKLIDEFFSPENIKNYVATIDELVDAGSTQIFATSAAVEADTGPAARVTATGVRLVFSNYHTENGLVYHLSLSREGYLPRDFASTLVAAFADRAGLMLPIVVKLGEHSTFHVVWEVPREHIDTDARIVAELRTRNRQRIDARQVFSDATINARNIRIETLIP